jgi:hypothetical protein
MVLPVTSIFRTLMMVELHMLINQIIAASVSVTGSVKAQQGALLIRWWLPTWRKGQPSNTLKQCSRLAVQTERMTWTWISKDFTRTVLKVIREWSEIPVGAGVIRDARTGISTDAGTGQIHARPESELFDLPGRCALDFFLLIIMIWPTRI